MTEPAAVESPASFRAAFSGCLLSLLVVSIVAGGARAASPPDVEVNSNPDGSYSITRLHLPGRPAGSMEMRMFTPKGIEWMVMSVSDMTTWPSPANVTLEGPNGAVLATEQLWAGTAKHKPIVRQVDFIDMAGDAQDTTIWFDDNENITGIGATGPRMHLSLHRASVDDRWHEDAPVASQVTTDLKTVLPAGVPASFDEVKSRWDALATEARNER